MSMSPRRRHSDGAESPRPNTQYLLEDFDDVDLPTRVLRTLNAPDSVSKELPPLTNPSPIKNTLPLKTPSPLNTPPPLKTPSPTPPPLKKTMSNTMSTTKTQPSTSTPSPSLSRQPSILASASHTYRRHSEASSGTSTPKSYKGTYFGSRKTSSVIKATASILEELMSNEIKSSTTPNSPRHLPPIQKNPHMGSESLDHTPITVMGCNRDKAAILARAEVRTKKQIYATITRECYEASLIEIYNKSIQEKDTREELRALNKENTARRHLWQKLVILFIVPGFFMDKLEQQIIDEAHKNATKMVAKFLMDRVKRKRARIEEMYQERMKEDFMRSMAFLTTLIKHWRKKTAVKKLKTFLVRCSEIKLQKLSSGYILRYVRAVKLVQRNVREYLKSQADLLRALEKIWDAIEYKYVTMMIRESVKNAAERPVNKALTTQDAKLDSRWTFIESKFTSFESHQMYTQRARNRKGNSKDSISTFALSNEVRLPYLKRIIVEARREVTAKYDQSFYLQKAAAVSRDTFGMNDALSLLANDNNDMLDQKFKHKMVQAAHFHKRNTSKNVTAKRLPFIFFEVRLDKNLVQESVIAAHDNAGTFYLLKNSIREKPERMEK